MAMQENRYKANIGTPSLILIFIVMCLVTFGMLSLSAAKNERNLAERNALAVTEYYRADGEGEDFYRMVLEQVTEVWGKSQDSQVRKQLLTREFGEAYHPEERTVTVQIPMERSQALFIELLLQPEKKETLKVSKWKIIQTENFEIDHSMPVWSGGVMKNQETGK